MRWIISLFMLAVLAQTTAAEPFVFNDGDRIAFIGSTIVEREQTFGWLETFLYTRYPDKNITLRNLGWSGDNVWGESRAGFGKVQDGYNLLIKQVNEVKPTVILIFYGENESFEGKAGLPKFVEQYNVLLNDLAKTGARIVLITPPPHESYHWNLPDPHAHNAHLAIYVDAIKAIGAERKAPVVDLFDSFGHLQIAGDRHLTDNGVHPNTLGFFEIASVIDVVLGGNSTETQPNPIKGETDQIHELRKAIIEKNRLYFCRYRPQNETYIFGFRKHEQGQNAVEIPQFDPLIAAQEKLIAELRQPKKP